MWWTLYLLPGLLLAGLFWEVFVNGWFPKAADPYLHRQMGVIAEAIHASPMAMLLVAVTLFVIVVAWPVIFLIGARGDDA